MAAAIPMIATFASGAAAGGIAAGVGAVATAAMGSITGFLTMGGGLLAGIGALTGDKDLKKLGAGMSLVGGLGDIAGKMLSGASMGGSAATAGAEASSPAAFDVPKSDFSPMTEVGQAVPKLPALGQTSLAEMGGGTTGYGGESLMAKAMGGGDTALGALASESAAVTPQSSWLTGGPLGTAATDPLAAGASTLTSGQLSAALKTAQDKASMAMSSIPGFIRDNKELVGMAGNALASMYGPQAEALDFQKSLMARRRKNLNSPVRLGIVGG